MNIQDYLQGLAGLVTGLASLITAIIALYKAIAKTPSLPETPPSETPLSKSKFLITKPPSHFNKPWLLLAMLLGLISLSIFVARWLIPAPVSVAITHPAMNQRIEVELSKTGAGAFTVSGISAEVSAARNLRLYVLVHPAEPFGAGWWIQQPAIVSQNGQWTALAWIGDQDFPPEAGDKIDLVVVAAEPDKVIGFQKVSDPKDIQPLAQSDIIHVDIGQTK